MAKWVLDVREDVCLANGKDVQAVELLKVMRAYGEVTPFETAVANKIAPLQNTIDNLVKRIEEIEDQNLTDGEMSVVKALRLVIDGEVAKHEAVEAECRKTITTLEDTLTKLKSTIIAVVGE